MPIAPPVQVRGRAVREAYEPLRNGIVAPAELWSLTQNVSIQQMRATVAPELPRTARSGGWDSQSLLLGGVVGVAVGAVGALYAAKLVRARLEAQMRLGPRSLSGHGGALTSHPAAHRLRAAAGSPDEEEFPLVG